jgi:competence protein ComEA
MAQLSNRIFLTLLLLSLLGLTIRELDYQQRSQSRRPDLTVYVAGEVNRPGSVSLPASARRMHAVAAAGGFTPQADVRALEPARHLNDGETVWVTPKISSAGQRPVHSEEPGVSESKTVTSSVEPSEVATPGKLDLNSATSEQLQQLPGIGPVLANRIVEKRNAQPAGTFATIEDLTTIRGIKRKTMARLTPFLELEEYDR